jgi:hypothetical protein
MAVNLTQIKKELRGIAIQIAIHRKDILVNDILQAFAKNEEVHLVNDGCYVRILKKSDLIPSLALGVRCDGCWEYKPGIQYICSFSCSLKEGEVKKKLDDALNKSLYLS